MYQTRGHKFGYGHTGSMSVRGPMSDDEIMRVAPSVFKDEAHESRSARFAVIPTYQVLAGLRKEGFEVVAAVQAKSRVAGKTEFTKHMLRLQHADHGLKTGLMVRPEAVLINANDGTARYRLMSGVLRSICLNSMICWEDGVEDFKVSHSGDAMRKVITGTFTVIADSQRVLEKAEAWQGITLNSDERMALADATRTLRLGDADGVVTSPIEAAQFLRPRRREDVGSDLWLTHNVLQENAIRGGVHGVARDTNGRRRNVTTREIAGIDGDVRLNKALWQLSARMAELKAGIPA